MKYGHIKRSSGRKGYRKMTRRNIVRYSKDYKNKDKIKWMWE